MPVKSLFVVIVISIANYPHLEGMPLVLIG